ncbi:hypothetical protein ElyMa_000091100 [Elysia marginata]|uniref:Uncharacterized protein n=1 Tax=Elysia marginata TaxID=1093978 RepID=A0AAV4EKB1_9GAST|nr:hypothetical protein ElyMa_000091100 [Elysia marginata]
MSSIKDLPVSVCFAAMLQNCLRRVMERSVPRSFIVQVDQPQSSEKINSVVLDRCNSNECSMVSSCRNGGKQQVMFSGKFENDPMRESMAISIVSIFFCGFIGILATFKASKALDHLRRDEMECATKASLSSRKYATAAIVGGLLIYFTVLFTNVFLVRAGNYKTTRYVCFEHLFSFLYDDDYGVDDGDEINPDDDDDNGDGADDNVGDNDDDVNDLDGDDK